MRLGIIGCGWMVELGHVPALKAAHGVEVVAVADLSPSRAAKVGALLGLGPERCTTDVSALLRDDVDAVIVATPPHHHRDAVLAAAAAGRHVLCEKPMAPTLDDADAMVAACDAAGVRLGVVHNCLWFPEHVEARRIVASGAIGDVVAAEISGLGSQPWAGADEYDPGWRRDVSRSGGGVLLDEGVHALYLIESYLQRPITAVTALVRGKDGIDTWASCLLELEEGIGTLNIAWGHGGTSLTVVGTEGHIAFVYDENAGSFGYPARVLRVAGTDGVTTSWYRPGERHAYRLAYPGMYEDFAASVADGRPLPADGADGRRILAVVRAAYRSSDERHRIAV